MHQEKKHISSICFFYLFIFTWSGPVNLSGLDVALRREIYWALADGEALLLRQSEGELEFII